MPRNHCKLLFPFTAPTHACYLWLLYFLMIGSFPENAFSQQYTYVHYEPKDGLAGSTVHGIAQDKDGFIWFATETGLSRFDGVHFKNFTRADGLPSNEIFALFADSKNRLWICSFKNAICYYYKGKIYNQQNDSTLRQITLTSITRSVGENVSGDILIESSDKSFIISKNNRVTECRHKSSSLFLGADGMQVGGAFFQRRLSNPAIRPEYSLYMNRGDISFDEQHSNYIFSRFDSVFIGTGNGSAPYFLKLPSGTRGINRINDSIFAVMFFNYGGTLLYNMYSRRFVAHYLPGQTVHYALKDIEGNMWFSTRGSGVFKISNPTFKTCFFDSDNNTLGVFSVHKMNNRIYVGTEDAQHWILQPFIPPYSTGEKWLRPSKATANTAITINPSERLFIHYSSSDFFQLGKPQKHRYKINFAVKTLFYFNDTVLVSSGAGAYIHRVSDMKELKELYSGRTKCLYAKDGIYYIGTLNGLYVTSDTGTVIDMGKRHPLFKNRISSFAEDKYGVLWIATYEHGIIGYRNGRIIANITQQNSNLSSDICRCLFVSGNYLWAGTEKGLNKIDIHPGNYKVTATFTAADGLSSDIINTVLADSNMIYVGTPRGLTYFDESKVSNHTTFCRVNMTGINVSGKQQPHHSAFLTLPHDHNNIRFEYAGISFLSGGDITYRYRLLGSGGEWQTTKETVLNYPSLPSGKYVLQLMAINKFHNESSLLEQPFEIEEVLWDKTWFRLCIVIALACILWLLIHLQIRKIRKKETEKRNTAQKIAELELEAIKAQINPHFIYNCLNSIQYFNYKKEHESSQEYLDLFASLIRKTMEYSRKTFITLEEETQYLLNYLKLEKLRFKDKLQYTVEVQPGAQNHWMIPAMLIQPYVENALKHAIPGTVNGHVAVTFKQHDTHTLKITVDDNGPGLSPSVATDNRPTLGLWLSGNRAGVYNQLFNSNIQVKIINKKDLHPVMQGTLIEILFPINNHTHATLQSHNRG
jgi:hypothetical protein